MANTNPTGLSKVFDMALFRMSKGFDTGCFNPFDFIIASYGVCIPEIYFPVREHCGIIEWQK